MKLIDIKPNPIIRRKSIIPTFQIDLGISIYDIKNPDSKFKLSDYEIRQIWKRTTFYNNRIIKLSQLDNNCLNFKTSSIICRAYLSDAIFCSLKSLKDKNIGATLLPNNVYNKETISIPYTTIKSHSHSFERYVKDLDTSSLNNFIKKYFRIFDDLSKIIMKNLCPSLQEIVNTVDVSLNKDDGALIIKIPSLLFFDKRLYDLILVYIRQGLSDLASLSSNINVINKRNRCFVDFVYDYIDKYSTPYPRELELEYLIKYKGSTDKSLSFQMKRVLKSILSTYHKYGWFLHKLTSVHADAMEGGLYKFIKPNQ